MGLEGRTGQIGQEWIGDQFQVCLWRWVDCESNQTGAVGAHDQHTDESIWLEQHAA